MSGGGRRDPVALAVLAVLAVLGAAGGACSAGDGDRSVSTRTPAPAPAPVVHVTMRDHRFELDRLVPAGRVVFRVQNAGPSRHHLTLVPLPPDVPPIADQLRGTNRRLVKPFAGIYDRDAGDSGTFAVDLAPDTRYALICAVVGDDGQPHWRRGMATEFRTPEGP